ncbi:hypothetical protein PUNSTDRAFT_97392 [Punctularia strigosozonata HHB-11173 SS5]|uniref:uncharacterized protein n=1 Tax=Punctularia strigosozonata (strain HHB-11173) TaxID=741275 RepID=UPI00044186E8|nr:uncharacterized protein PUNSTDRAFT_97392 [Punctularia strigosozonata HHB-11173 SS5]EIN12596.1 hypothetical protein PUNSTDRAFT_97392 [Punctularia strigosozonata HHB-11173 SS5]
MVRGQSTRPASSEEAQCWAHASSALRALNEVYASPSSVETIGRVNRLISAWPTDDTLPGEGYDGLKLMYKKLTSGLNDIRNNAEAEVRAIDEALERLEVLIGLRRATEATPPEKRMKRGRSPSGHTPLVSAAPTPISAPLAPKPTVSITLPPSRPSSIIPFSRDPRARREALAKQLPLEKGRKVAFHPPTHGKAGDDGHVDENTWILAVILKSINQDKNRYEVQDPEPQEDGQPGQVYNTTLRSIIPLPDDEVPPNHPAHLNNYHVFEAGSTVMALYPDTSTFYKAQVITSSRDMKPNKDGMPMYKLKFEDDEDQEHSILARSVVEWPGP